MIYSWLAPIRCSWHHRCRRWQHRCAWDWRWSASCIRFGQLRGYLWCHVLSRLHEFFRFIAIVWQDPWRLVLLLDRWGWLCCLCCHAGWSISYRTTEPLSSGGLARLGPYDLFSFGDDGDEASDSFGRRPCQTLTYPWWLIAFTQLLMMGKNMQTW